MFVHFFRFFSRDSASDFISGQSETTNSMFMYASMEALLKRRSTAFDLCAN